MHSHVISVLHTQYTYVAQWYILLVKMCVGVHSEAYGRDAGVVSHVSADGPGACARHVQPLRSLPTRGPGPSVSQRAPQGKKRCTQHCLQYTPVF